MTVLDLHPPVDPLGPTCRSRRTAPGPAARAGVLLVALLVLVGTVVLSLAAGSRALPTGDVLRVLLDSDGSETAVIVRELRLPRTVVGVVVGAALGLAGAQFQALTRNPLADPGLLGVSAGAALAVVSTSTVVGVGGATGQAWAALLGASAAALVVYLLAGSGRGGASPLPLLLAGVAMTALLNSLTTVLVLLDADTLDEFRFWQVGSVAGRDVALLEPVLPFLAFGLLLTAATARTLDLLGLGDDLARGLGARVARGRAGVALSGTLLTAAAVSVAGPLAFVGLVVPHLGRALVGPSARWLLPLCALLGASLLLVSDVLGRVVARPAEVQVGIVLALVGVPVLVSLARRRRLGAP